MKKDIMTIDDFVKCDFRVGRVTSAVPMEGSDKMLKLTVDMGGDWGVRTILSGIAHFTTCEELEGKNLIFLANLAPRKMMGDESQGMMIAIDNIETEKPSLMFVNNDIPAGSQLR